MSESNPTVAGLTLVSGHDNLFKSIITAGWAVESDGHVESPQGYFAVVEVPAHEGELKEMSEAVEPATDLAAWPESGWYFTSENSLGQINVWRVENGEQAAHMLFHLNENLYAEWEND